MSKTKRDEGTSNPIAACVTVRLEKVEREEARNKTRDAGRADASGL